MHFTRADARMRTGDPLRAKKGDGTPSELPEDADAGMAAEELYRAGLRHVHRSEHRSALPLLQRAAEQMPHRLDVLDAAANVALIAADLEAAERWYAKGLELDGTNAARWSNMALCLRNAGRLDEAREAIERAASLRPAGSETRLTEALILIDAGRFDAAEKVLQGLIVEHPDLAEAHTALAHVLLLQGRFEEGWNEYEWRKRLPGANTRPLLPIPCWGGEAIPDGTLLVTAEQGLGDQIMLCSCITEVIPYVGQCWVELDPRLASLVSRSIPAVRVLPYRRAKDTDWLQRIGVPDWQIGLGSLPRFVRRKHSDFRSHDGYLQADPERVRAWRQRLHESTSALRIGISWRGGAPTTRGKLRSIPLALWAPLLKSSDTAWVSLQYGLTEAEQREAKEALGDRLAFFPGAMADYEETAALVQSLDLIITVQTAVAHLTGALGKPVWILLPVAPEWRYMARGNRLLWYPSARLFRQARAGDWTPVLAEVEEALRTQIAKPREDGRNPC